MKKIFVSISILLVVFCATLSFAVDPEKPLVRIETTKGNIVVELDKKAAPKTVDNFLDYVRSGSYDGTIFHRVIKGFMIQGGGFTAEMINKETKTPIMNEADNGLSNDRYTIAMARTGYPHSATNQFFINTVDNSFLNFTSRTSQGWGYCVFGKVIDGKDVVDAIEKVSTRSKAGYDDVPEVPVIIKKIFIN